MKKIALALSAIALFTYGANAQFIYNFGDTTPLATPSSGSLAGVTAGAFSIGNSNGTVTAPINTTSGGSFTYTNASKAENLGTAVIKGPDLDLLSSSYFQMSLVIDAGTTFSLTEFDFGVRSTSTGATNYSLYGSYDGFSNLSAVSLLTSGTIANDSTSSYKINTFSAFTTPSTGVTLTLRLYVYGYNGASTPTASTQNTRIDDIGINTTGAVAVPEPGTVALFGLGIGAVLFGMRRRRIHG